MISFQALLWIGGVIAFMFLLDWYAYHGIRILLADSSHRIWVTRGFWIVNILLYASLLTGILSFMYRFGSSSMRSVIIGIFFLTLVPKLVFAAILLMEDVFRLTYSAGKSLWQAFSGGLADDRFMIERRKFISQIGIVAAGIPFAGILYGITKGKYDFTVHRHDIFLKNLPDAFDGFTITQLSDIHVGSFDNADAVKAGVDLANEQRSKLMLFTGDLVNNRAEEMEPWLETFRALEAPLEKFSTYGNHDYGDYVRWDSIEQKQENMKYLADIHRRLGFRLMMNENALIRQGESTVALIGIENWGLPPFPQKGDLNKALAGVNPDLVKILMSHDPTHWDAEVLGHRSNIDLTLAGHTHGMQFGIEIPGIKWSPVEYRYPRWAGLYQSGAQYLHVNRGFGFIGLPGRVGIWPEITVLTLRKAA